MVRDEAAELGLLDDCQRRIEDAVARLAAYLDEKPEAVDRWASRKVQDARRKPQDPKDEEQ